MTETNSAAAPATESIPAEAFISQLAFGALLSQALYVAAKLGIADLVEDKPLPIKELAARTESNERALYRILRSLASVGVFQETDPGVFGLTPYAEILRTNAPGSFQSGVIFMGEEWHWRVWGHLAESVKTGRPAWGHVHGAEVFDYFSANPVEGEIFNRAMTDMSVGVAPAIIEAYDF